MTLLTASSESSYDDDPSKTPIHDLLSLALRGLNDKMGWESDAQKKTFLWSSTTDPVDMSQQPLEESCEDHAALTAEGQLAARHILDRHVCAHTGGGKSSKCRLAEK